MNRSVHSGVIPELLHSQGVAAEHWLAHVPRNQRLLSRPLITACISFCRPAEAVELTAASTAQTSAQLTSCQSGPLTPAQLVP